MAIKADKLLDRPSELHRRYSGRLAMQKSLQDKMVGGASGGVVLSKKSITNIETMRTKVTQIEGILKGTLALEKKDLDNKKRLESGKRREKQEEKLETKPNAEKGQMKMPSAPRLGILDWIKNFIGKIILGYFAVRLIEHLPKIMPIVKFLGSAADFIINIGGDLLNKLITFVDWGYKAYDATRGFMKSLGGENFAKGFDKFMGAIDTALFLTTALAGAMALEAMTGGGDDGFGGGGGRGNVGISGRGAGRSRYGASPAAARRYAERFGIDAAKKKFGQEAVESLGGKYARSGLTNLARKGAVGILGKGGAKAVLKIVRPIVRNAPLIGGLLEFGISWALGDPLPKAAFRGVGTFLLGAIGTAIGGPIGLAIGGFAGGELGGVLYDMFFGNKKPQPKGKVQGKAGGGITRGGKTQGGTKRTIGGTTKKGKYKRTLAQKPTQTRFKTKDKKVKEVSENLDKTQYFGPVLSVAAKVMENEKPDKKDYENAGLGLNLLIAKGIEDGQLKGGLVAAFAEGGMVDDEFLSAAEKGSDISNWIASTFNRLFESKVEQNLRLIKERQEEKKDQPPAGGGATPGDGVTPGETTGGGTADVSLNPYRRAFLDTLAYAEGTAKYPNTGYNTMFTGKQFSGFKDHPRQLQVSGRYKSDAAGRYQFLSTTWAGLGLPDFSPANQDKGALKLLAPHVLTAIDKGDFATAFHGARKTWASLPGAGYGQPEKKMSALVGYANSRLEQYKKGQIGTPAIGVDGRGGDIALGKGYGSEGSKIAGELGRYLNKNLVPGKDFLRVTEHPEHGGVKGRHAKNSYHYANPGRAIDIGAWDYEQPKILNAISQFNAQKGVKPVELIHAKNDPRGHGDHVHVAYFKGGRVRKLTRAILGEKGPEFVFDADTTAGLDRLAPQLLERLNMAKTKPQLASILQMYTDYEQERPQIIEVPVEVPVPMPVGGEGGGGFAIALGGGGGGDDFASGLYKGG